MIEIVGSNLQGKSRKCVGTNVTNIRGFFFSLTETSVITDLFEKKIVYSILLRQ
jgi:hypothetical protein